MTEKTLLYDYAKKQRRTSACASTEYWLFQFTFCPDNTIHIYLLIHTYISHTLASFWSANVSEQAGLCLTWLINWSMLMHWRSLLTLHCLISSDQLVLHSYCWAWSNVITIKTLPDYSRDKWRPPFYL